MPRKNKSINILNDDEFKKLPVEMRVQTMYKLHEALLESSMGGGFVESLIALRENGEGPLLLRHAVLVIRMEDQGFPPEMKTESTTATHHREIISLDSPPEWVTNIPVVAARIAETVGQIPKITVLLPPEKEGEESKTVQAPADTWGITCVDNRTVLHAIGLDVMMKHVAERVKNQQEGQSPKAAQP